MFLFILRAFDVELLYIAQCFKIPIAEVAVNWTEVEGTTYVVLIFLLALFSTNKLAFFKSAIFRLNLQKLLL